MLAELARRTPLLTGADQVAYVDVDVAEKATYGYAKQGAGFGDSGVKGLNAVIATVSTPRSADQGHQMPAGPVKNRGGGPG